MINLRLVIQKYPECMQSKEKLSALLNDLFPDQRQMAYILALSYDCGIVDELKRLESVDALGISKFTQRLMLRYGVQEQLALEGLKLWCEALNVKQDIVYAPENTETLTNPNKLKVGAIVNAKVKAVLDSVLIMDVGVLGERAVLPKAYCINGSFAGMKVGHQVTAIVKSFTSEAQHPYWILSTKIPKADPWHKIKSHTKDDILIGTITSILQFGFFVDLGDGIAGLVHRSEYSTDDQFSKGQTVRVTIRDIDDENRRVSLHLLS